MISTIALITNDTIGENMAGPGIRYWEMGRALALQGYAVRLIVPPFIPMEGPLPPGTDLLRLYAPRSGAELRALLVDCDVLMTLGIVLTYYPFITALLKPLVIDLYDPFLLAGLRRMAHEPLRDQLAANADYLAALYVQLRGGDFFLCAAEKQRDYWLGMLSAMGRLNPYTYQQDATFRKLIDVAPFGLPSPGPVHRRPVLKGVHSGIAAEDRVLLWGGGIWNWFDAPTAIRAMPLILAHRKDVKLFFMGIQRPNQSVSRMVAADEAIALSKALGLYDTHVFFNDWVPYEERQNYLLEADVGVSLHLDDIEARFAFRTRLLDYLWAKLPIVATSGDVLGEELASQGVAELIPPQDEQAFAARVLTILDDPHYRAQYATRAASVAHRYRWEAIVRPLADFCAAPRFAVDRDYLREQPGASSGRPADYWWRKAMAALRFGGPRELFQRARAYFHWRRQQ